MFDFKDFKERLVKGRFFRGDLVCSSLVGRRVEVYNGLSLFSFIVRPYMVGFPFGFFSLTKGKFYKVGQKKSDKINKGGSRRNAGIIKQSKKKGSKRVLFGLRSEKRRSTTRGGRRGRGR